MQKLYRRLITWGKSAVRSIAFLPVPMMLAGLLLGIGLFHFEMNTELSSRISEKLPALMIQSQETARSILGLFIGGLITLVVFTFTQLMSLFNQVANSYSPRLLPLFTGDRSLQFTMGFYLGTIVMTLIVLLSIRSDDAGYVPNLSVLFCIVSGVASLMIFVYFVTNVSGKIRVDAIIERVYRQGVEAIKKEQELECFSEQSLPGEVNSWPVIPSPIDGFLGSVDYARLSELAEEFSTRLYICTEKGEYIPKKLPLLQCETRLESQQVEQLVEAVSPIARKFDDWYLPPVRLLLDIALKAMSPGINDPGTAINVIDRLTGLLGRLMKMPIQNHYQSERGGEVWMSKRSFQSILTEVMQQMRTYCKEDTVVIRRLFRMLFQLYSETDGHQRHRQIILDEIHYLLADSRQYISNAGDRRSIAQDIRKFRSQSQRYLHKMDFLTE